MTTKINASTAGLTETVDTSGILEIQTANTAALIIDASQNANFVSTGAITVPVGTTAQRPTGVNGMIRYNSNTAAFEFFANSAWTAANVTPPAVISVAPVISGSAVVGQNLTSTTGTWTGTVTGYYYQWLANSTAISNATANVFTLTSTQNNTNITCNVTAYNIAGNSTPSTSNSLGPVTSAYLINNSLRFRRSNSAYMSRTPSSSGNAQKWTWSGWIKRGSLGTAQPIFGTIVYPTPGNYQSYFYFNADDTLEVFFYTGPTVDAQVTTAQVFRDPAAWYHLMVSVDTTQATASNRIKIYVNGSQVTALTNASYPTQNYNTYLNSGVGIGNSYPYSGSNYLDGYLSETNFIDGQQLTPSSFGQTDTTTGAWIPIRYAGTYGTTGFYLNFSNATSTTTLGYDSSGNGNNFTTNNFSVTAGSTYDAMTDVPTLNSATAANFAVLNPIYQGASTAGITAGNLQTSYSGTRTIVATMGSSSGKFYYEMTMLASTDTLVGWGAGDQSFYTGYRSDGTKYDGSSFTSYGATYTTNDVIGVAVDLTNGTATYYKNNTSQGTITGITFSSTINIPTGYGASGASNAYNFGQRPFAYTPPTGYVAVNAYNI